MPFILDRVRDKLRSRKGPNGLCPGEEGALAAKTDVEIFFFRWNFVIKYVYILRK